MMGAGMVPPPAPTPPSQLSFKGNPNQRMQFKNFMQSLSANQQAPVVPAMMPMPQIPIPMQNIDVFAQPVQFMQRGGITNRPEAEMDYTPANVAKQQEEVEKSRIQKALERREKARQMDDSNERRNFPKLTPTPPKIRDRGGILNVDTRTAAEINAENAIRRARELKQQGKFPDDLYGSGSGAQTEAELIGLSSAGSPLSVKKTALYDPDYITPLESEALNQGESLNMLNLIGGLLSDSAPFLPAPSSLDPVDRRRMDPNLTRTGIAATFLDPRQSGLGTSLSEQISLLEDTGTPTDIINESIEQKRRIDELDDEDKDATTVLKAIEPNFLSRLPGAVGDFFYKGQIDNFKKLASLPNFSYDNETGIGTVPVGSRGGELVLSPSGVITYRGQKDPNYSVDDPFATLIRPFERSSKSPSDPCPPGYVMINGACTPITQPATTATAPTTPTPNVIQTTPVVTTPSPVVPSTAPPVQLGMPLGQTTPVQPMSQFFTNVPNSLNTAASNFLSALSS